MLLSVWNEGEEVDLLCSDGHPSDDGERAENYSEGEEGEEEEKSELPAAQVSHPHSTPVTFFSPASLSAGRGSNDVCGKAGPAAGQGQRGQFLGCPRARRKVMYVLTRDDL